jgi:ABC-type transport system involved in Fe-S cluster assembly, permease and ATPase components
LNNKIVVIIAHRLSTIRDVDNIYVLNDGKVIDKGNHESLLIHSDQYKKLYYNE